MYLNRRVFVMATRFFCLQLYLCVLSLFVPHLCFFFSAPLKGYVLLLWPFLDCLIYIFTYRLLDDVLAGNVYLYLYHRDNHVIRVIKNLLYWHKSERNVTTERLQHHNFAFSYLPEIS